MPENIILGGRQGRHGDAIRLLTHGLGDFDTAVSYCVLGGSSTYGARSSNLQMPLPEEQTKLFSILLGEFLTIEDLNQRIIQTTELLARFSRWFTMEQAGFTPSLGNECMLTVPGTGKDTGHLVRRQGVVVP